MGELKQIKIFISVEENKIAKVIKKEGFSNLSGSYEYMQILQSLIDDEKEKIKDVMRVSNG